MSLGREYADEIAIAQLDAIEKYEQWEYEAKQNLEKGLWETKDGELLEIKKMTSSHIKNCIRMLERGESNLKDAYIKAFEKELKDRTKEMER